MLSSRVEIKSVQPSSGCDRRFLLRESTYFRGAKGDSDRAFGGEIRLCETIGNLSFDPVSFLRQTDDSAIIRTLVQLPSRTWNSFYWP